MTEPIILQTQYSELTAQQLCDIREIALRNEEDHDKWAEHLHVLSGYAVQPIEWKMQDAHTVEEAIKKIAPLIVYIHGERKVDIPERFTYNRSKYTVPIVPTTALSYQAFHEIIDWQKNQVEQPLSTTRHGLFIAAAWLCQCESNAYKDEEVLRIYRELLLMPASTVEGLATFFSLCLRGVAATMWPHWINSKSLQRVAKEALRMKAKTAIIKPLAR